MHYACYGINLLDDAENKPTSAICTKDSYALWDKFA